MNARIAGLVAAVLVILGSFLPWARVSVFGMSESMSGMEGDGVITLFLGIAMAVLFGLAKRGTFIAAAVVSLLAGLTGAYDLINLNNFIGTELGGLISASAGIGLYLVVIGGLAGVAIGVVGQGRVGAQTGPTEYGAVPWGQVPQTSGQSPTWGQEAQGAGWGQGAQGQAPGWGQAPQSQAPGWGQAAQSQAPAWGQTPPVAQQPQPAVQPVVQPAAASAPAGWLADPYGHAQLRYWDGARWTEHTHNHPQG